MHELRISDIEAAGFREFPVNRFSELRHVSRNWQKTYWNAEGQRLYFVTIEQWDYGKYPDSQLDFGYEGSGYFKRGEKDTFIVELLYPESVEQIEAFFRDLFQGMNCTGVDD